MSELLKVERITKKFRDRTVLKDVSFNRAHRRSAGTGSAPMAQARQLCSNASPD
jgi:hypothetical protein